MRGGWNPADIALFIVVSFLLVIVGFFMFPGVYTQITSIVTTGWIPLSKGTYSLIPYAIIGTIFLGILILWKTKGNQ